MEVHSRTVRWWSRWRCSLHRLSDWASLSIDLPIIDNDVRLSQSPLLTDIRSFRIVNSKAHRDRSLRNGLVSHIPGVGVLAREFIVYDALYAECQRRVDA